MSQLHLRLHRAAALEDMPRPNNHRQVVRPKPILRVRRMVVRMPRRPQDHVDRDPGVQALLAQRESLQRLQAVLLRGAVHGRVAEDGAVGEVDDGFGGSGAVGVGGLEFPGGGGVGMVPAAEQTGGVVTFVEELEDAGQDFGFSAWVSGCRWVLGTGRTYSSGKAIAMFMAFSTN